jgi:hypothetical protein
VGEERVGELVSEENPKSSSTVEVMIGVGLLLVLHLSFYALIWLVFAIVGATSGPQDVLLTICL